MKGKNTFTTIELETIRALISKRIKADRSGQKTIRDKMRKIGFYGSDFNVNDLKLTDFERLLKSGIIKNSDGAANLSNETAHSETVERITPTKIKKVAIEISSELNFIRFDPAVGESSQIPNSPGNYIICLKENSNLPNVGIDYVTNDYSGLQVIYTGIAGSSLRTRDFRQHFNGNNAGRSTLRKSLGSLMKFAKIPRDKDAANRKTKFNEVNEAKLSEWMKGNLILFYRLANDPESFEESLILEYNPPLNLSKNKAEINIGYRKNLSDLRR